MGKHNDGDAVFLGLIFLILIIAIFYAMNRDSELVDICLSRGRTIEECDRILR